MEHYISVHLCNEIYSFKKEQNFIQTRDCNIPTKINKVQNFEELHLRGWHIYLCKNYGK